MRAKYGAEEKRAEGMKLPGHFCGEGVRSLRRRLRRRGSSLKLILSHIVSPRLEQFLHALSVPGQKCSRKNQSINSWSISPFTCVASQMFWRHFSCLSAMLPDCLLYFWGKKQSSRWRGEGWSDDAAVGGCEPEEALTAGVLAVSCVLQLHRPPPTLHTPPLSTPSPTTAPMTFSHHSWRYVNLCKVSSVPTHTHAHIYFPMELKTRRPR